ncbi:MAG: glycosyltransferase family 4 protein [Clostridia bacterium]|nr:glycosyltransferase family 4 protein [Clostridia bacterium]
MRLILFADRLPPKIGGMETHAHYFAQYFKDKYEFYILSRLDGKDVLVDNEYRYIEHVSLDSFLPRFKDSKTVLFFNSGRWIEDLRHIRELLPSATVIYRTGGNEIIKAPLTRCMPEYEKRRDFWREAINYSVDYLITNSAFTDGRLIDFGIKKSILRRIAGGIDPDTVSKAISLRSQTRQKYGIGENDKLCVSCARFVPYKRTDFLIRALAKCKSRPTLLLAGDGPLEDEMRRLASELEYPIRFLGNLPQADAVALIAAADVYAQASANLQVDVEGGSYIHTEGMGRSLLEAICSGVPVVVTDCGAVGEYINKNNGSLVNTEEEMAKAIDSILNKKAISCDMAYKYAQDYSFDRIFREYIELWK